MFQRSALIIYYRHISGQTYLSNLAKTDFESILCKKKTKFIFWLKD